MIGRLTETSDTESSDPHVEVSSASGVCQVITSNARNQSIIAKHLGEVRTLSQPVLRSESDDNKVDCSVADNLNPIDLQDAVSSQDARGETSKDNLKCVSDSETIGVMSVNTLGNKQICDKTLQPSSINCQEQKDNLQDVNTVSHRFDKTKQSEESVIKLPSSKECDTNPIAKCVNDSVFCSGESERANKHINIFQVESNPAEAKPENEFNSGISVAPTSAPFLRNESEDNGPESSSEIISISCQDVVSNVSLVRTNKSNISVVKVPSSKTNIRCTTIPVLNLPHTVTKPTQSNTSEINASPTSTVLNLNAHHSANKLKNNSHMYKVQNVLLRTPASNANGFVTKLVPSILPTGSESAGLSVTNASSRGSTSVPKPKVNILYSDPNKDIFKTKRSRKMAQMSFKSQYSTKRREPTIDDLDSHQKQAAYTNKLPNIISKIRDNLSENSVIKTKPSRKLFVNSPEKHAEQMSVVRKYEPKYSTNNVLYTQHIKPLKRNRVAEHLNPNRNALAVNANDKNYEVDNFYDESDSPEHYPDLTSSELTNQEICSRTGSKQTVRTGQNNNIDVMSSSPNPWKQVTPMNIGTTVISENVTPINASNTWEEVPRICNKSDQEETSYGKSSHELVCSPQILLLRGDPQAVSQRKAGDEEFIGEEIRPEPTDNLPGVYHSLQIVLQDHNYGALPPSTPLMSPAAESFSNNGNAVELIAGFNNKTPRQDEEDVASVVSIESIAQPHNEEDEETETAPEEENDSLDMMDDKNSITRCICDFQHDDGYMIQCGQCLVWQHIVCVGVTPKRIPKKYLCDFCQPRELDRYRAHALQKMIRDDLNMLTSSDSSPTRGGDKDRVYLKNIIAKKRGESSINFPLSYNTTRNKRIRQDPSPKMKVRRQYKERKKVLRRKVKTDMDRPSVRPWLENYELAATNHYSQELRARLAGITKKQEERPNFILTDCTTIPFAGGRIMISTIDILPNTPIIELMGKFMLSSQHQNATALLLGSNSRQVTQKPGPFVFFYRMPQEGTDVCIDTRTFGNEARFVRRSCKPNCELHHWFDKGTLHIYLMSIDKIESNTEITLRHEFGWHGLGIGRTPSNPCACNSPECLLLNPVQNRRNYVNESLPPKASLRVGKSRGIPSRSYLKSKSVSPKSDITIPDYEVDDDIAMAARQNEVEFQADSVISPVKFSQDSDNTSDDLRKIMQYCSDVRSAESPKPATSVKEIIEEPAPKPTFSQSKRPGAPPSRRARIYTRRNRINKKHNMPLAPHQDPKPTADSGDDSAYINVGVKDIKKMTREERKIAQVMKVFDRLEKDKAKKSSGAPRGRRQDSESDYARRDESTDMEHSSPVRVHKRGKGRRKSHLTREYKLKSKRTISEGGSEEQPSVKKQLIRKPNSVDGRRKVPSQTEVELNSETSGTSSPNKMDQMDRSLNKRGLRKRKIIFPKKQTIAVEEPQQGQQTEEAAGLLLALARSTPATPCEPGPSNEVVESPIPNMISVCQLVEAAVGPLETSLKSPKKAILNEWMNKSPESPLAYEIPEPPAPNIYADSSSSSSNNSPLSLLCLGNEPAQSRNIPSSKLLDTLVQAASSICDIGTTYSENDASIIEKDKLQDNVNILEKEMDNESKDTERVYDNKMCIVDSTLSTECVFNKPVHNEPFKDESRTFVKVSNANSINDEKLCPPPNEVLNDISPSLKFDGKSTGISETVCQIESHDVEDHVTEQMEAYENNSISNACDNSCNVDVCAKSSALDISTDLSNDSNVYSSYQVNNSGSAKKRWLHQALSEESDIPAMIEVSTPLKKRRLVRESTSDKVQINSDDINELPTKTKNFQSATTVATSNEIETNLFTQNKDAVVADNDDKYLQLPNCVSPEIVKENHIQTVKSEITNGSAFDWENLENHYEIKDKLDSNNGARMSLNICNTIDESMKTMDKAHSDSESPQKHHISDEIADIHKRLQSFHSENIQVLRSRNQKPKTLINESQRKKVNLKFEVSILEDQTVAVELCNEPKKIPEDDLNANKNSSSSIDAVESLNTTQIVSFDFDEFARHESSISQMALNLSCGAEQSCDNSNHESLSNSPQQMAEQYVFESTHNEYSEKINQEDSNCLNLSKTSAEKCQALYSFKDVPPKLETNLQIPLCSPTTTLTKHEIGVAARARLDSILNATDISQDAMFDQVLKKPIVPLIPNHIVNVVRNDSTSNSSISSVHTGHSKNVARTSSSDPRLHQVPKKKLSLTEYRARKKTDGGNSNEVFLSNEKSMGQLSVLVSDNDEEPNEQENFMFTPEPTLVERELEKHPAFLLRDFFTVPSSIINDAAIESETDESSPDPC